MEMSLQTVNEKTEETLWQLSEKTPIQDLETVSQRDSGLKCALKDDEVEKHVNIGARRREKIL